MIRSGMARGIDTCAHKGCFGRAERPTIAIWGTGIDVIYPKENKSLAEQIAGGGTIVSELPMGTFSTSQNIPKRKRILSEMSIGVLVVEVGE
jgi:DNA processing protein